MNHMNKMMTAMAFVLMVATILSVAPVQLGDEVDGEVVQIGSIEYTIVKDSCMGCSLCSRKCPVGAISGALKQPHKIDVDKCIRCGACKTACKFGAVTGL